jgi:hypothetical protein
MVKNKYGENPSNLARSQEIINLFKQSKIKVK